MAGERNVEHCRFDAGALDNVLDSGDEEAGAPSEGATGFEDYTKVGVAAFKGPDGGDEEFDVVTRAGHKVPATAIQPFELRLAGGSLGVEQVAEARFESFEGLGQVLGPGLAKNVKVKTLDAFREGVEGVDTESRAGLSGVIKVGLDGRVTRVDAKAARDAEREGLGFEAGELGEGVEGDVGTEASDLRKVGIGEDGSVSVDLGAGLGSATLPCGGAKLLGNEARLGKGTCGSAVGVGGKQRKNTPHSAGFQGHYDLGPALAPNQVDDGQIALQRPLVEHEAGRGYLREINHQGRRNQTSRSMSNFSIQGRPAGPSAERNGSGLNCSTLKTPEPDQSP